MDHAPPSDRKGWGLVRWIALLVLAFVVAVVVIFIGRPIWEAKRTEQALNDRYGEAVAFVPEADGSIPRERVEAFLRIRERMFAFCPEFQDRVGEFLQLNEPGQDGGPPENEKDREAHGGLRNICGQGRTFRRFMETRNQALLDEGMGLGEYIYIYVLAYSEQLRSVEDSKYEGIEAAYVGTRARGELAQILENQLQALASGEVRSGSTVLAADLQEQITALGDGRQTLPWENGFPTPIAASLAPYAKPLAAFYCEGIAKIELSQKNKGFDIKN